MIRLSAFIHRRLRHHSQARVTVSVPQWDPYARGILITCECGKSWAL